MLVGPTPVHAAHAMTDEVRAIVNELVTHRYDGLRARRGCQRPHELASIVVGPLVTGSSPRLRALLPDDQRINSWGAPSAVSDVLDNTDPDEDLDETARRILSAVLRTLGADPLKVKHAIQATTKRR